MGVMKISSFTVILIILAIALIGYRVFVFDGTAHNVPPEKLILELTQIREDIKVTASLLKDTTQLENREYKLIDLLLTNVIKKKTKEREIIKWFGEPKLKADAASDLNHIDGWSIYIQKSLNPMPDHNQIVYGYRYSFNSSGAYRFLFFVIDKQTRSVVNFHIDPYFEGREPYY